MSNVTPQLQSVNIFGSSLHGLPAERIFARLVKTGIHEWAETAICQQFFSCGATAFDIGANIGYYTALMRQVVGRPGQVHAFEANPVTYQIIKHSAKANDWDNVTINHCAVASEKGEISINPGKSLEEIADLENYNLGGWSIARSSGDVKIPAIALDDYCDEHNVMPKFMKIDVEGFELEVLKGAKNILSTEKPPMMVEFSNDVNDSNGLSELYEYIESHDYAILKVMKKPYIHLKRMALRDVSDFELAYAICVKNKAAKAMGY